MKQISSALQAHLAQEVTTLASCWLVTRTDGVSFAFTDHDADLVVGGLTYVASSGYLRSALKSDQTLSVDNMEIIGILNSSAITQADLQAGKFDYAEVEISLVNWADLSQGILMLRAGTFGETIDTPTGTFTAEMRGLSQALTTDIVQRYSQTCRADFGDAKCKVPVKPAVWTAGATVAANSGGYAQNATYVSDPNATDDAHRLAVYLCTTGGTTGTTAPSFNPTVGATTTESTGVVWISITPLRQVATVGSAGTARNTFTAAFTTPGNNEGTTATVMFGAKAAYDLVVVLTVGAQTVTLDIAAPYNESGAINWLTDAVNTQHALGNIAATAAAVFPPNNGQQSCVITKVNPSDSGNIVVENDLNQDVSIVNFGDADTVGNPYWAAGVLTWVTGNNAGLSMEVKDYTPSSGILDLFLNMPFAIQSGDKFYITPACDKSRATCSTQWGNILNFRGEPDVPGLDALMRYPVV